MPETTEAAPTDAVVPAARPSTWRATSLAAIDVNRDGAALLRLFSAVASAASVPLDTVVTVGDCDDAIDDDRSPDREADDVDTAVSRRADPPHVGADNAPLSSPWPAASSFSFRLR